MASPDAPGESEDAIVLFYVHGNLGSYNQIIPICNSLHNITAAERANSANPRKPRLYCYSFDFKEQPSAFSGSMMRKQALFISTMISHTLRTEFSPRVRFSIIAHSMGAPIANLASALADFPTDRLNAVFSLSGTADGHPHTLSYETHRIYQTLRGAESTHSINVNVHGHAADLLVPPHLASLQRRVNMQHRATISTTSEKNVYSYLDHINPLFSKRFLEAFLPFVYQLSLPPISPDQKGSKAAASESTSAATTRSYQSATRCITSQRSSARTQRTHANRGCTAIRSTSRSSRLPSPLL